MEIYLAYSPAAGIESNVNSYWKKVEIPNESGIQDLLNVLPSSLRLKNAIFDNIGPSTISYSNPEDKLVTNGQYSLTLIGRKYGQKLLKEVERLNPPGNICYDFSYFR